MCVCTAVLLVLNTWDSCYCLSNTRTGRVPPHTGFQSALQVHGLKFRHVIYVMSLMSWNFPHKPASLTGRGFFIHLTERFMPTCAKAHLVSAGKLKNNDKHCLHLSSRLLINIHNFDASLTCCWLGLATKNHEDHGAVNSPAKSYYHIPSILKPC